jgi:uncharacterized protein (TIGR00369 family)
MTALSKQADERHSPEEVAEITRRALAAPLHGFLGFELVSQEDGRAVARFQATANTLNYAGAMHGGVAYALLDAVCYLALVPLLGRGENAVTHDLHVSVLRPVLPGQEVELRGRVVQKGRSVVFCESEAWAQGRLTATARVTKTLVAMGGRD